MGGKSVESKNNDKGIGEGFIFLLFAPEGNQNPRRYQRSKRKRRKTRNSGRGLVFPDPELFNVCHSESMLLRRSLQKVAKPRG